MITVSKLRNIIIGRLEDGGVQIVRIDCTEWSEAYPNLTYYRIEVTSPNGLVYIPVTRMEGNVLIWPITQSDTATSGEGMYQVVATGADGEQKTSDHPKLYILPVMPGTAQETPPAPSQPWVDQVLNAAERAEESADKAETASAHSPVIGEGGTWLLWDADAGAYVDSGVKAVGRDGQPGKDAPQEAVLYTAQSLSGEQQAQARQNIAAASKAEVNKLSEENAKIKDDLSDKLPKSPANWEQWTADEQTAARERMGIAGYELIVDVPTLETVSNFHITLDSNGNALALKVVTIDFAGATGGDNCLVEINNGYLRFTGALGKGRFGSFVGIPLGNDYYCYYFTNNAPDRNQLNPNSNQFMAGVKADTIINDIWFRDTVPAGASIQIYGIRG